MITEGGILPSSPGGAAALAGLALVSHVGGQGFLTYALGHLPAAFSSLVVFIEAPAAALFAWAFLGESLSLPQAVGGILILGGIYAARPRRAGSQRKIDRP
jgi:drug/metabolite transporter (DMT)-like permease